MKWKRDIYSVRRKEATTNDIRYLTSQDEAKEKKAKIKFYAQIVQSK
jgi:hypothetical protein